MSQQLKLTIIAAPGGGKTTFSEKISSEFDINHISVGGILRSIIQTGTPIGLLLDKYVSKGELVPDDILFPIIDVILSNQYESFCLDGYPRSLVEAQHLDTIIQLDLAINIQVSDMELFRRLVERHRTDDTPEIIKKRLEIYHTDTEPVIYFYEDKGILRTIDGERSIDDVYKDIKRYILFTYFLKSIDCEYDKTIDMKFVEYLGR